MPNKLRNLSHFSNLQRSFTQNTNFPFTQNFFFLKASEAKLKLLSPPSSQYSNAYVLKNENYTGIANSLVNIKLLSSFSYHVHASSHITWFTGLHIYCGFCILSPHFNKYLTLNATVT